MAIKFCIKTPNVSGCYEKKDLEYLCEEMDSVFFPFHDKRFTVHGLAVRQGMFQYYNVLVYDNERMKFHILRLKYSPRRDNYYFNINIYQSMKTIYLHKEMVELWISKFM